MDKAEFTRRALACEAVMYRAAYAILGNEFDACDAAQEAVAKAYCKRSQLRDKGLFETWLMRILINECRDELKKRGRQLPYEDSEPSVEAKTWLGIDIRDALKQLPEKYSTPVVLHYFSGYTLSEIAAVTGKSELLIKSRLSQARGKLKELLGGDYLED